MPYYVSTALHSTPGGEVLSIYPPHETLDDAKAARVGRDAGAAIYEAFPLPSEPSRYRFTVGAMVEPPPPGSPPLFIGRAAHYVIRGAVVDGETQYWTGEAWGLHSGARLYRPEAPDAREGVTLPDGGAWVRLADLPQWRREFWNMPESTFPIIPAPFTDESYHNDVAPSFYWPAAALYLWADYPDEIDREMWSEGVAPPRFRLYRHERDSKGNPVSDEWGNDALAESNDWREVLAAIIGERFAFHLREEVGADRLAEVRRLNALPDYQGDVCASHNACDANMPMAAAFAEVMGRDLQIAEDTPEAAALQQSDFALWGAAWTYAKRVHLTAPPLTVEALTVAAKALADAMEEAITAHIYDEDNGDEITEDCHYTAAVSAVRELVGK